MRFKGRITRWNDERGFGVITQQVDGRRVFVHVTSFLNRQRRPSGNEIVTYDLKTDAGGRPQAERVVFSGEAVPPASSSRDRDLPLWFILAFVLFLAGSVFIGRLPVVIPVAYLAASVVAFAAYAFDKSAARNNRWRTRESTLHLFALAGGWPGALAAQRLLRHKSRKLSFQTIFWMTVVLNGIALGWLFSSSGHEMLFAVLGAH